MLELPPLSLYIHIPWCVRKCPYCDFNSHQSPISIPEQAYVRALIKDLDHDLPWVQGRKLHSIFFGGGTPSLFSAASIEKILHAVQQRIGFSEATEITLEANPGTAEQQKFADFKTAGINRLSLGIQSFDKNHLKTLGRIHDGEQARWAIDMALHGGFKYLNVDLMHGLPNQHADQALNDLEIAISSGSTHISWYQLTIEPNTEFYSKPPPLPADDQLAEIQQLGQTALLQAGFEQYEVSAFALGDVACRHNINYWQFGDYLGIGAGAHGKISLSDKNQIIRSSKTRQPKHYLATIDAAKVVSKAIDPSDLPLEFMMNGLRLKSGIPADFFPTRTGLSKDSISSQVAELRAQGLLEQSDTSCCASELGYRFLNSLLQRFS